MVITGPIGAGKTTVADLVASGLARGRRTVAVVDLDDVAYMQRGGTDGTTFWRRAGLAHVALVRAWFDGGADAVVAHGPLFESGTYDALFASAPAGAAVHHLLLTVTVEEALRRVTDDPDRRPGAISRDPGFLRGTHEDFARRRPTLPTADLTIDTTDRSAQEVADAFLHAAAR